jgi:hypothetical protein
MHKDGMPPTGCFEYYLNVHPVDIELRQHPIRHLGYFLVSIFDVRQFGITNIAIVAGTWRVRRNNPPIRGTIMVPPA